MQVLASLAKAYDFNLTPRGSELLPDQQLIILHGTGGMPVAADLQGWPQELHGATRRSRA